MTDSLFQIGAHDIDTQAIVEQIKETVAQKRQHGIYDDPAIARAERANLDNLKDEDEFLAFYLECLQNSIFVDISDFEIRERRTRFACFFIRLKRTIWNLLKFYTYRLWSQQNQINGLLLFAIEGMESRHMERILKLEERIKVLEDKAATPNDQ